MFRRKKEIFYVGKVKIIINESTLDIFRNTIYYVDVQDVLCIKGVPFITCDIYELCQNTCDSRTRRVLVVRHVLVGYEWHIFCLQKI